MSRDSLTVWHENRADRQDEIALTELCERFLASEYRDTAWPIERAMSVFLATERLTWEDRDTFHALCDLALDARRGGR